MNLLKGDAHLLKGKLYMSEFIKAFSQKHALFMLKSTLVVALVFGPAIYFYLRPDDFTPLMNIIFSVFLLFASYWLNTTQAELKAEKRANDKWLPQAESVILRLLTLYSNVSRFAKQIKNNCEDSECSLPELRSEANRAIKIKMQTECKANSERLADVANQLDDAISDWQRFVTANCEGNECARIFDAVQQQRVKLSIDGVEPDGGKLGNFS